MTKQPEPSAGRDLDQKYRPRSLDDVRGQETAVATIRSWTGPKGKGVPRVLLFHGPPGCGKTTMAKIVCADAGIHGPDLKEVNCGILKSPIDYVRSVKDDMTMSGFNGGRLGWILDEAQTLSRQKGAQEALLPVLENPPPHVQFIFCTTEPTRLLEAVRSRCVDVAVRALKDDELRGLVADICAAEGFKLDTDLVDGVVAAAEGSARNAVKALEKVAWIDDPDEARKALAGVTVSPEAFELVKVLLPWRGRADWTAVRAQLETLKDQDPEGLRCMILGSARAQILKDANAAWAAKVVLCLDKPLYERSTAKALLAANLWYAFNSK